MGWRSLSESMIMMYRNYGCELWIFFYNNFNCKTQLLHSLFTAGLVTLIYWQKNTYVTYNMGYAVNTITEYTVCRKYNFLRYGLLTLLTIQYSTYLVHHLLNIQLRYTKYLHYLQYNILVTIKF